MAKYADTTFMGVMSDIGTLVGIGSSLRDIFGGSKALTIDDIKAAVLEEVTAALRQQAVEAQIINASATLQAAQNFLTRTYLPALDRHTPGSDTGHLWFMLTDATDAPSFDTMNEVVTALQDWMAPPTDARIAAKGMSICLGLYLYMSLLRRERAAVAPPASKGDELGAMRSNAQLAVQMFLPSVNPPPDPATAPPSVNQMMQDRLGRLTYQSDDNPNITDVGGVPVVNFCTVDNLHDASFDDHAWLFAYKDKRDPSMDYAAALHWVERATRRLLWSGEQADADELARSFTDGWLQLPYGLGRLEAPFTEDYRDTTTAADLAFGKWAKNARSLLISLDAIASGYSGKGQDGWAWCSACAALYYSGAASRCPASAGPHRHDSPSSNYVLRCDPVSTQPLPDGVQDNWRWCHKCSGLFFNAAARICPAGGAHDASGSGSYLLGVAPIPDPTTVGIDAAQDDWRWCPNCAALHFGAGVCPAGGSHGSTGSGNYWLNFIGMLPQAS
jgi:hypothetical protein